MPYTYSDGEWKQTTAIPTVISWADVDDKPTTFPPDAHLHDLADVTGLVAALAAKASAATSVTAGTGLSGGGTLAANRTLAVNFGQSAGTVCAGDDSRLANQRTPSDASVTNAKVAANAAIALSKLAEGLVLGSKDGTPTTITAWVGPQANLPSTRDPNTVYLWY